MEITNRQHDLSENNFDGDNKKDGQFVDGDREEAEK